MPNLRTFYVGALLASAALAQSPCFDTSLGTDLLLADDQCSPALPLGFTFNYNGVGYTTVSVCSNGYLWLGSGTTADWSPTETELLTGAPRICPLWMDFNPSAAGSGHVYANNPSPATFTATWAGVYTFNTTSAGFVQITLDAGSNVTVTYGNLGPSSSAQGGTTIIGASPGGTATSNPVSLATRPAIVSGTDNWADVLATPTGTPAPYANTKMQWAPSTPGYVISDVTCTPNNLPGPASVDVLGAGCPQPNRPSAYEVFTATNAPDVSGMDFTFLPNGSGGYIVLPGIAGPFFTGFTTNLGAGDDTTHAVALPFAFPHGGTTVNNIVVSSNGFLTLGTVNPGSGCCTGSAATLLSGESCISGWWADLNAGAGGGVFADLDATTGEFVVTWNAVPEYVSTGANTFQIALDPSGTFKIRIQSVARSTHDFLLGYSYGHGANANAIDMSAVSGLDLGSLILVTPLSLASAVGSRPALGSTYNMNVTGISAAPQGNVALLIIGFTELNPGVDLGILGAPGCTAFFAPGASDLNFLNFTGGVATTTFSLGVPNTPALAGLVAIAEAVSDDTSANSFGWKFSNGLRLTVGL